MARSTYIYVAMDRHYDIIVLGTVKREVYARVLSYYSHIVTEVRRYRDANDATYVLLPAEEWSIAHLSD